MIRKRIQFTTLASVIAMAIVPASAMAQAAPAAAKPDADADTNDIIVTGLRASLRDAIAAKRASTLVTETISSKDIGVLPDVTFADALGHLPGVNTSRDRGNASQASVRGLGPRLVLGLVNGREVATSEPDRNVRWEIYPSEAVSEATVYKSQGADLIAGGVAATIDIRTLRPLDYVGPKLTLRAGAQLNDAGFKIPGYSQLGSRGNAQFVTHLTDTLGFSLGGSYQKQKNGYGSFQGWGYNNADAGNNPPTLNGSPVYAPWGAQTEVKALAETRWSTSAALQWKPNGSNWEANADILYSDVKIDENQFQQWHNFASTWGATLPNWAYSNGNFTLAGRDIVAANLPNWANTINNVVAKYTEDKSLLATGLNVKYGNGDDTLKLDGSYSQAIRNNSWVAAESTIDGNSNFTSTFNTAAGVVPSLTTSIDPAVPSAQNFNFVTSTGPQRLVDTLAAFQADYSHALHGGLFTSLDAGLRYSHRVKSFTSGSATIVINNALPSGLTEFSLAGSGFTAPNLLAGNFSQIATVTASTNTGDKSQYWRVAENDMEAYVKGDFAGQIGAVPFYGNLGVRMVDVTTHSNAYQATTEWDGTANVTTYSPIGVANHYFRVLPSLNINFDLTDRLKLRAGVARVMSRPPLDELRASQNLQNYAPPFNTGSAGNPNLRPFMATQGDLSLEWYFHKDAVIALAGYYKKVDTNVGYAQNPATVNGVTYTITSPSNGPGGHIVGGEMSLSTPFYFVPGLDHFGIYANVALVGSNLKELVPVANPFPAVGVTKFTGQLDLWYSDHGIDARVGLKHHSPYTVIFGWDASKLTRLESETTLGASVSYALTKTISLRVQANNLTNQVARFYYDNDPNELARYEKYGRSYLADVTVKF